MGIHRGLLALGAAFVTLAVVVSVINPLWEGYDELGHYPYVRYLKVNERLPPPDSRLIDYGVDMIHQPPLYYAAAALATSWIDTRDWEDPLINVHISETGKGGRNQAVHTDRESFPWSGWVLAVHVSRWVSIAFGLGAVLFTYLAARKVPQIPAGLATALVAFTPGFVFISSIVNNDAAVAMMAAVALFFALRVATARLSAANVIGLALALVLAVLSKTQSIALFPVALLAFLGPLRDAGSRRQRFGVLAAGALTLLPAILTLAWWETHNVRLHGGPQTVHGAAGYLASVVMEEGPLGLVRALHWDRLGEGFRFWFETYWANFGWGNVPVAVPINIFFALLMAWGVGGFLVLLLRRDLPQWGESLPLLLVLVHGVAFFILPVGLLLMEGLKLDFIGRYTYPGISSFAMILAVGLVQPFPKEVRGRLVRGLSIGLFLIAAVTPMYYIPRAYAPPARLGPQAEDAIQQPLGLRFGADIELVGYDLRSEEVTYGEAASIALYWRALGEMDENYSLGIRAIDAQFRVLGDLFTYPYHGNYATVLWDEGDLFRDPYSVPISVLLSEPLMGQIELSVFDHETGEALPMFDREGNPVTHTLLLGEFRVVPREAPAYERERDVYYRVGEEAALVGYDLDESIELGSPQLELTLYWESLREMDRRYSVFVHLLDVDGGIVAQGDSYPREGMYPTSVWVPGEVVRDPHVIEVPTSIGPGEYSVAVGWYWLETLERLPAYDASGRQLPQDTIILESFEMGRVTETGSERI